MKYIQPNLWWDYTVSSIIIQSNITWLGKHYSSHSLKTQITQTNQVSSSRATYGVSIMRNEKKICCIITAPNCIKSADTLFILCHMQHLGIPKPHPMVTGLLCTHKKQGKLCCQQSAGNLCKIPFGTLNWLWQNSVEVTFFHNTLLNIKLLGLVTHICNRKFGQTLL